MMIKIKTSLLVNATLAIDLRILLLRLSSMSVSINLSLVRVKASLWVSSSCITPVPISSVSSATWVDLYILWDVRSKTSVPCLTVLRTASSTSLFWALLGPLSFSNSNCLVVDVPASFFMIVFSCWVNRAKVSLWARTLLVIIILNDPGAALASASMSKMAPLASSRPLSISPDTCFFSSP